MAFLLFLLLIYSTLGVLLLKKSRNGILLVAASFFVTLLIGCGVLPSLLSRNLQAPVLLEHFQWKSRNTIILLGAGLVQWPRSHQISSTLPGYPRIHEAAKLYFQCKKVSQNCTILASGGDPAKLGISEAEVMKRELSEIGVPEANIILEPKSNNTYQNAEFSSSILNSQKNDTLLLVTSGGHMRRSLLYFSHFGINAVGAPSDQLSTQTSWIPLSYNFLITDLMLHEYGGVLQFHVYNLLGWNQHSSSPGAL